MSEVNLQEAFGDKNPSGGLRVQVLTRRREKLPGAELKNGQAQNAFRTLARDDRDRRGGNWIGSAGPIGASE